MGRFPSSTPSGRRDGWTPKRQLDFLEMLARTGSVTRSARAVGMSRESAYRLRSREPGGLFAVAWDRVLTPAHLRVPKQREVDQGHIRAFAAACGTKEETVRHWLTARSTS